MIGRSGLLAIAAVVILGTAALVLCSARQESSSPNGDPVLGNPSTAAADSTALATGGLSKVEIRSDATQNVSAAERPLLAPPVDSDRARLFDNFMGNLSSADPEGEVSIGHDRISNGTKNAWAAQVQGTLMSALGTSDQNGFRILSVECSDVGCEIGGEGSGAQQQSTVTSGSSAQTLKAWTAYANALTSQAWWISASLDTPHAYGLQSNSGGFLTI